MNAANLAYLMRYIIAGIVLLTTIFLLRHAIRDFSGGMRRSIKPTPGYFLLVPARIGHPEDRVRSLPLFHTTIIGRHNNCDIRINNSNVGKRHASIYLYDGDWYIEPLKKHHSLMIQGIPIRQATPLRNGDKLTFGGVDGITLIFVDERESSARRGVEYVVPLAEYREDLQRRPVSSPGAWLLINLFAVLGGGLLVLQMQAEFGIMRRPIFLMLAAFFLILNLYQLIIPRLFRYCDRIVIAAVTQLIYIGIILQLRLTLLRPVVMNEAIEEHAGSILRAMLSLVVPQMGALAIGLVLLPVVMALVARTRFLEIMYPVCLVLTPLLLIVTLVFGGGGETHGATLWLQIGGT
ncbi:MAG TPA: FHA domain-containing protein, partial [Clostridiaceae bacterium]|nr:FHA domain-containing protein [Clostridiaceae bacterium]